MKLLIDANIVLDVLQNRKPYVQTSSLIWKLCETKQVTGYLSALTFANLVYIMRKELDPEKIDEVFRSLSLIFEIADLNALDIKRASELKWGDFEDAVQSTIAERLHVDYIITRNGNDFLDSPVKACSPAEFLTSEF